MDQKGTPLVQNLSGRLSLRGSGLLVVSLLISLPAGFPHPLQGATLPPRISGLSISPDGGKVLVSTDADGIPNAWALPTAPAGKGEPVQLTRSTKDPVWVVSYFPADERFLYRGGPAGDEEHLFVRERDGKAVELVPGKATRFFGWAGDGKSFFVEAMNSSGPSWDLFRVAAAGYEKTRLDRNSSHISRLAAVSADGRYVAYSEKFSDLTRHLRLRDLTTGQSRSLRANEGFEVNIPLRFSPDGRTLLLLHDGEHPFRALERVETATGPVKELVSKELVREDWDLLDAAYSPDGKRVALIAGGDSRSSLQLYDTATWKPVPLPGLPATGEVSAVAFSRDGRSLAFVASASDSPPAVWLYDLAKPGAPRRLSGNADDAGGGWVAGEVRRFKASFDQQEIPGILYKPRAASPEHPVPAVVWVHDGPSGQATLAFDPLIQALVGRGYAVYAVNPRGSFGYGKPFLELDDRRHGEGDLQDCIDVKKQLAATGWVDPARIAIGVVGFGGFLTLDALAFEPQAFAAGVDLFGVADWQRLINSMPYGQSERTALTEEMGHVTELLAAQHMNPRAKAGDIVRPLLIVQGGEDTLAIPADAAEIAGRMKGNQRTVELVTLPDAAHGLVRRADREKVYAAVADFLDANLKGAK